MSTKKEISCKARKDRVQYWLHGFHLAIRRNAKESFEEVERKHIPFVVPDSYLESGRTGIPVPVVSFLSLVNLVFGV
jgi:hypothetical protein